jgi:hypothetical protein
MSIDMAEDVEQTTPLKVRLFESVRRQLIGHGFVLNAVRDNFVRRHDGITDIFQLTCLDAKPGYRILPGVAVRIERVENIFHETSGFERKYQKDTPTMGTRMGSLLTGSPRACEFLLESESEIASVTEMIVGVFREFAPPYFEKWGSLAAIDAELNDKPGERMHNRALAWFRCSTGIIVAKLVGRHNYGELVAFYTDVMTRDNKGFYLKRFQALVKSLESVEPGSGLANQP